MSEVRTQLINTLRAELVGPYERPLEGEGERAEHGHELLRLAPSRSDLTGFLAPPELVANAEEPATEPLDGEDDYAGSDVDADDSSTPDPEPATRKVFPASIGLSGLIPNEGRSTPKNVDISRVAARGTAWRPCPAGEASTSEAW